MRLRHNKPYKGLFITFEGGDGCGKSTLSHLLVDELQKRGHLVTKTREPGGTALGEQIRELLLSPNHSFAISPKAELLLYLAARAQNVNDVIIPALQQGHIVICERFNDSSVAYQGCARKLGMHVVETLCHQVIEEPDFTFLLDLDPIEGMRRIQKERKHSFDRLEQEKLQFHKEVRQGYLHLADQYPDRITLLDASQSIDKLFHLTLDLLEPFLSYERTR